MMRAGRHSAELWNTRVPLETEHGTEAAENDSFGESWTEAERIRCVFCGDKYLETIQFLGLGRLLQDSAVVLI